MSTVSPNRVPTTQITNQPQMANTPGVQSSDRTVYARPSAATRGDAAKRILAEMGKLGEAKEKFLHARADEIAAQNELNKEIFNLKSTLTEMRNKGAFTEAEFNEKIAGPLKAKLGVTLAFDPQHVDGNGFFNLKTSEARGVVDGWQREIDNALKSAEADGASRNVEINIEVSMVSAVRKNQSELADSIKQKHQSTRMA